MSISSLPSFEHVHVFASAAQLGQMAGEHVARLARQAVSERGRFTVAFSGGSLPKLLCPTLVAEPLRTLIDWPAWHIYFVDERCVPLTSADSNYRLLREVLLDHVPVPPAQVYTLDHALAPLAAAEAYATTMHRLFGTGWPRFDLVLLGMGPDGHTASLFPHHRLLQERRAWVAAVLDAPKPPPQRITLTLPVINNARQVSFVVTGAEKATALAQALRSGPNVEPVPAGLVQPGKGGLDWFVDEAAAEKLSG